MVSKEEILRRSHEEDEQPTWCLFWPGGKFYGHGKWLKKYAFYPQWLPLPVWVDHSGPSLWDDLLPHEHDIQAPHVLRFSKRTTDLLRKKNTQIASDTIISPFVYYRRAHKIKPHENAKGTVVFPAHSISTVEAEYDRHEYIKMLKDLPEQYQPITICMFYMDILKNRHKEYMNHFNVTTCGRREDSKFVERFYEILRLHRYATSNEIGSQLFYAVECGIPFFLYGPSVQLYNKNNSELPKGKVNLDQKIRLRTRSLFSSQVDEPTQEQLAFVEYELGVKDTISRFRAAFILYKSLIQFLFQKIKRKLFYPRQEDDLPPIIGSR